MQEESRLRKSEILKIGCMVLILRSTNERYIFLLTRYTVDLCQSTTTKPTGHRFSEAESSPHDPATGRTDQLRSQHNPLKNVKYTKAVFNYETVQVNSTTAHAEISPHQLNAKQKVHNNYVLSS